MVRVQHGEVAWSNERLSPEATQVSWQALASLSLNHPLPEYDAGYAWYRFRFALAASPEAMYALRINRMGPVGRIYLNGALLHATDNPHTFFHVRGLVPLQLVVPPSLLQPGQNELLIEKVLGRDVRLAMSDVLIGPASSLAQTYARYHFLTHELRDLLNIAALVFGLLMLQVWFNRRSEVAIGLFGVLCVLNSVRVALYFSEGTWIASAFFDWFFFAVNAVTPLLLGLFAMHFSGSHHRPYRRLIFSVAVLLPTLAALAVPLGFMPWVRLLCYPIIIGACVPAAAMLLRAARSLGGRAVWMLAISLGLTVIAAVHDYFLSQGVMPVYDTYWLMFTLPAMFMSFGAYLLGRLVKAAGELEKLNLTLEERVAARTSELELASAAKTRFLASASHDLRQPTHTISLLVGLLRMKVTEPALQALIGRIDDAVSSMEYLLKGLLDLSRLDAAVITPDIYQVRLDDIFQSIGAHLQPEAEARGIRLRFRASGALASTDPVIFERIMRNLVVNALQHTVVGGVLVGVRRVGTGMLRVEVHDTGTGIAEDQLAYIFQEFYQVDNVARQRHKGLGLGLSIAQRSAQLLGHALQVRSRVGGGTTFSLTLPGQLLRAPPEDNLQIGGFGSDLRGALVALVEDEDGVREGMTRLLEHLGARVVSAVDADTLLVALRQQGATPDVLISDFRLPDEDGLSVIGRARAQYGAGLPVLLITGDTAPSQVRRIKAANVPVLFKPCGADELYALLVQLLAARRSPGGAITPV